MESNYNLLSENQFGEVVAFAPLIRVPRNATSCPCVSCQESKTFSCYSSGGGVLIPLAEETVGAGPIVPSAILSSPDCQLPSGPFFLPARPCVCFQGRHQGPTPFPVAVPATQATLKLSVPQSSPLSLISSLRKVKLSSHQKDNEKTGPVPPVPYQMNSYRATAAMLGRQRMWSGAAVLPRVYGLVCPAAQSKAPSYLSTDPRTQSQTLNREDCMCW